MLIKKEEKMEYLYDQNNFTDEQLLKKYINFDPFNVVELQHKNGEYDYFLLDTDISTLATKVKGKYVYSYRAKQLTGAKAGTIYDLSSRLVSVVYYIADNKKNGLRMRVELFTNMNIGLRRDKNPLVKIYGDTMNYEQLLRVYTYRNRNNFYFNIDSSKANEWTKKVFESDRLPTECCTLEEDQKCEW